MPIRVGVLSAAHVHAPSFVACLQADSRAEVAGVWDDDAARGRAFAEARGLSFFEDASQLLADCDAAVICSENMKHAAHIEMAADAGRHILCEKPLAPTFDAAAAIEAVVSRAGVVFMTAFPCPFSPTFQKMKASVDSGEIGQVLALNTTNRGQCPMGWFVDASQSGGGAMIDHVVHVADLLRRLLGADPVSVFAQTGSNMYGQGWDDIAKLTISFPAGVFATLDSSWSRPKSYKTWGDVTLKVVGSKGLIEADLFGQGLDWTTDRHAMAGSGSNLDALMVGEFLRAVEEGREPLTSLHDGLMASRVALAGYASVKSGRAEAV